MEQKRISSVVIVVVILALGGVTSAWAQSYGVGLRWGVGTDLTDDFESGEINDNVLEAQVFVEIEPHVLVRLRLGRLELDPGDAPDPEADLERLGVDVEYQFNGVWATTGFFLGGGYYKLSSDGPGRPSWDDGDGHFGYYGGVSSWLEVASDVYLVPELMVERVSNREDRTLAFISVALAYRF